MTREIRGTASTAISPALAGRRRSARVAGIFPGAIYLADGDDVVAVVARDAIRLPNSVVLPVPTRARPFRAVNPRHPASIGEGQLHVGALRIGVAGRWDPRPAISPVDPAALARRLTALRGLIADTGACGIDVPPSLLGACQRRDADRARPIIDSLIGLGPGLTPSGDDLLAGLLAAMRLLGGDQAFTDTCAARVAAEAPRRTTALSATLLRLAAAGQVSGEVADLLRALAGKLPLDTAVARLSAVGHTSGTDLASGVLIGGLAALASLTGASA